MHKPFAPHLDCMYVIVHVNDAGAVSTTLAYGSTAAHAAFNDATDNAFGAFSDPLYHYHRALKEGGYVLGVTGKVHVYRFPAMDVAAFEMLAPNSRAFPLSEIEAFRRKSEPVKVVRNYTGPDDEPYAFYIYRGDPENDDPGGYVCEVFEVSVFNTGAVESIMHFDVTPCGETVDAALFDAVDALTGYLREAGELDEDEAAEAEVNV